MPSNPPSPFPSTLETLVEHVQKKGVSIFLGLPCYGCRLTTSCMASLVRFQAFCITHKIKVIFDIMGNESLITRGRSILAQRFLQSDATHLLFIDSDISFDPKSVLRMIAFDGDVTAGIYAKKGLAWDAIAKSTKTTPEALRDAGLQYNINLPPGEGSHTVTNGFLRVLDAATGFFCIKRKTLETIRDATLGITAVNDVPGSRDTVKEYPVFFDTSIDPVSKRYLSEDYHFCRLVQDNAMDVYVDITAVVSHTGSIQYDGDLRDRLSMRYTESTVNA